ncbi:MAG TPA: DinB family protein [Candidatus Tectomicrobia bacterium]|nr:DinB family protein [Candidatus Tectomicrobia bacterium]
MTTALALVHMQLQRMHAHLDRALEGLTPEQLHQVPAGHPAANTIAWNLWHYVRTEDNVTRFVLQNRRPTVWQEGGYAERLGLPPVAQGTGMSPAEAQALRIKDVALFAEYMRKVWASADELIATAPAESWERTVTVKPLGDMPAIRVLMEVCLTHGFGHLGEIDLARTLVGAGSVSPR